MPGRSLSDLSLDEVVEHGVRFATGVPVEFRYVRSAEKAPYLGTRFGQDLEPAGVYMVHNPDPGDLPRGWVRGVARFRSPLVLALVDSADPEEPIYGPLGWKARLHRHYGKTGKALSRAILADGFDAVVTVGEYRGTKDTREIVDLSVVVGR